MKYVLLIITLFSGKLFACSNFNEGWDVDRWIDDSNYIYHGMVVSIALDKKSIHDGETDPLVNAISLRGEKHITLKVFESLKGKNKSVVKATLPECLGGVTEFGDSAILFKIKDVWHIKPLAGDWADEKAPKVLSKLSKVRR